MRPSRASIRRPLCCSLSRFSSASAITAALILAAAVHADAQSITWDAGSGTNFNWDTIQNWSGDLSKPVATDDVLFPTPIPNPGSLANPATIILTAGEVANSLTFNDTYTLTGGTLALSTGNLNSGNVTIAPGKIATINSTLTGAGSVIAKGTTAFGTLQLGGNNTAWTGRLQADPNAYVIATVGFGAGSSTSLPSGDLTLNGGRLAITPSIGSGLATTPGLSGRWDNYGTTTINDTFATPWFVNTAATRTDATVNFPNLAGIDPVTGVASGLPPGVGIPSGAFLDRYAVVYNGLVNITNGGSYTFFIPSDDGATLFIDGVQIAANEGGHGMNGALTGAPAGTATLAAGQHQITLKNTNGGTGGGIQLGYQGPDQTTAPNFTGGVITNTTPVIVTALSNPNTPLAATLTNTITVPAQATLTNTTLETSGMDTISNGAMSVGDNGNVVFASATSHTFTQAGPVTLGANAGLSSNAQAVTVPIATTLTPANVVVTGNVTLTGNANLNADTLGALAVNGPIDDGAGTFGIIKNGGAGTVTVGGTLPNTFDGPFTVAQGLVLLNKSAGVNAVGAGGLNLNTSIATGTAAQNYAVVRLLANEQLPDTAPLTVATHPTVGYGVTLDLNNFTETVGSLNVTGATTNMGRVVMGLTGRLVVNGDITMNHLRNSTGNTGRETLITGVAPASNALNLFAPGTGTLDLGGATRNITVQTTVSQLNNDGTIDSVIVNGGITKLGGQRLVLNGSDPTNGRNSTFGSGIALNAGILRGGGAGAQTDSAFGTGTLTINSGVTVASGGIVAGLPSLELRNNTASINIAQGGTIGVNSVGQSVNNVVNYGNNVVVPSTVPIMGVDVNNYPQLINGATVTGSGGQLRLGTLTTNAALQLNVIGGNNYALAFNGLALGGTLTANATTGNLQLNNLSGGNNIVTIAGATGSLLIGGNGSGFSGNVSVAPAGTLRLVPTVGVANNLFGTGTFTTAANPTIGIAPTVAGGTLTPGTPGGLTAKFYQLNTATNINSTAAYASIPSGVMPVSLVSDGAITNRPPTVTGTSFTNDIAVYTGLLNITAGGNYTFQTYVDDQSQLVIDGMPVISVNANGGGTGIIHSPVSAPLSLSAGLHTIAVKVSNQGGGGGIGLSYSGADSGNIMRPIPSAALQTAAALSNVANSGVNQSIAAAGSLTLDGGGTDLDGGINDLTFAGATGTLNVTNVGGIGAITVSGTTSIGANTATLNPTTGLLGLVGDVTGSGVITKTGAGALILAGAKTFTGAININVGGVQVTDPNSLGTTAGGTTVASGAVLDLNGVALGAEPLSLNGTGVANVSPAALWNSSSAAASASGPITLAAATTVGGFGDMSLTGPITGTGNLTKIGPDTLTLTSANNVGTVVVSTGFLKRAVAGAFGTNVTSVNTLGGGVFDLTGFPLDRNMNLTGSGTSNYGSINSLGTLVNTGASGAVISGVVTLGGAANIGSSSFGPGGDFTITTAIAGAQPLTKVGGNTLTLTGASTAPNAMNVNLGTVILSGAGTMTGGNWTVNPTATVTLDNTATNVNNRLGARVVNLVGANLNIIGNATAPTTEAIGGNNFTTTSGHAVVTLTPNAAQPLTLSSSNNLARGNNGTILFRGTGLGNPSGPGVAAVTFGGTPQTIGQFGGIGTKNRAIIPWAAVDNNASGDGASFAASGAGGLLQGLNPATDYDVNTITGANNILVAGATAAPAGNTLINSITLAGGNLTVGAGNTLQVDSGAIGAGANGTISGGTINQGIAQSANVREFVVYTAGAGTNLTINSVLATSLPGLNAFAPNVAPNIINRGGLTKAGLGTLTLGAQNTYIGSTRLNGGTTVLAGGANTIFYPATTPPAPGSLVSAPTTQALILDPGATLDLNGNNQRIGIYASNAATNTGTGSNSALPGTYGTITNSSATAATLRISQASANFVTPSSIAGNVNVQRDGGFTLTLTSPNTYTGTTVINGGLTVLQDGATLGNTSSITMNRSALRLDESQLQTIPNRIASNVPITLNGGAINFTGRGGGTQNVFSIGQGTGAVTIGTGSAMLQQSMAGNANANGAGSSQVNIGNIVHAAPGGTLTFGVVQNGAQPVGDNPRFFVSQINGAPVPTSTMLPAWITTFGQNPASAAGGTSGTINNIVAPSLDFAQNDPATGIRPILYTSTIAPGNNVNLGANTTLPAGTTLLNSLRVDGATTITFAFAAQDILNLQSGGLLSTVANNARSIGLSPSAGQLTAGGIAPSSPSELYIYNGANTLTINAKIVDNATAVGANQRVTPVFSAASQAATIQLNGANTYTGTTYANGVVLNLNAPAGGVAIPGDLIVGGGTGNGGDSQNPANQIVRLLASNQFAPTSNITVNGGYVVDLNNQSTTINNLTFAADGGSFGNQGPALQTGNGTLTLNGGVTATTLQQATTIPVMQGNLSLPAGAHTFDIGTFVDAPGEVGLALNSAVTGAGTITKSGAGVLGIGGNSPAYTGAVAVNTGTLQFSANNAGLPGSVVTIAAGATLSTGGFVGTVGALAGPGTVTSTASTVPVFGSQIPAFLSQLNVGGDNSSSTFGGLVTGVVTIGKVGTGNFSLTNPANNYSGGTLVNGGTFTLAGSGVSTTGSGLFLVNNTGNLAGSGVLNGGLQLNPGSAISVALTTPGGPAPINTGSAGVNSFGPTTVNFTGTPTAGTYPVIDYGGSPIVAAQMAGLRIGAAPAGFLYGFVNNAANTSIDLSVETVGATKTWTGTTNGTWDTTTANWSPNAFANGDQAVFTDSVARKTITGGAVSPQAISVNNSFGRDYSIANPIGGSLAGGLTKSGTGVVRLTGANTFGGAIAVNGGTLRASASTGASGLGSGAISLGNGATLQIDPTANTSTSGITGRYFHQPSNANFLSQEFFQLPAVTTQTDFGTGNFNVLWTPTNRPANALVGTIVGGSWESFGVQWIGKINITAAGPYGFYTASDDGTRVLVDGVLVNNNDGGKGTTEDGATITLAQGLHDIRVEFVQGTGGAEAQIRYQGPGIAKQLIPASVLFAAENVANGFADNNINVGSNVTVAGTSTINLNGANFTGVQIGGLTSPGGTTLNLTGNTGKLLRAAGTFVSGGTVTYNTTPDLALGQVTDGGAATTIVKQGPGRLILDNTPLTSSGQASSLASGTIFDVQGGKLVAIGLNGGTNPLGSAQVRLNGGGLLLDTKQNNITFDNAVSVAQSATLEVLPSQVTITLGSGANGVTLSGGSTLGVDLYGGARNGTANNSGVLTNGAALTMAGAITGTGNLAFRSPQFNQEQYPAYGTATLNANNTFSGTTTITGGFGFQNVANPITVTLNGNGRLSGSTGVTLNAAQLTVDDSATVNTGRILSGAPLTLRTGSLNLLTSTGANSGETLGAVTLDSGWNRVILQNQAGAGLTGLLTGASLVRNNRSVVQFQGTSLGGAATNASLVKFTTVPALAGGGGAVATPTISVLPYATGASNPGTNPPTFMPVTYDATNGIRPINTTTEITTTAAAVANANVRDAITAATTLTPTVNAINSWTLDYNSGTAGFTTTIATNPVVFNSTGAGLLLLTAGNGTQQPHTIASALPVGINFQGAEGNIIVTNTAGATISAVIAGTNGLTVSGNNNINTNSLQQLTGGNLTLSGDNSAGLTGTVTINGTLIVNSTTTDLPLGNAANPVQFGGGTLRFNNANSVLAATRTVTMLPNSFGVIDTTAGNQTIAGPITGSGGLVKINANTLTLSNPTSDYSGPTTVLQGNLVTTTGPQGNLVLSTTGGVTFAQAASGAYTGNISGIGSVTANAPGQTITLGDPSDATKGVNSYSGGTTVTTGTTLRGTSSGLVGGITNPTGVVFEQSFDGTSSALIAGAGTLAKLGPGRVTLVNAQTYAGATDINDGALIVDGSIAGSGVSVNTGAILGGSGTIASLVNVNGGGTLAPGPSGPGDLTALGATTFMSGSTFALQINGTTIGTGYDQLTVGSLGSLTISGGNVTLALGYTPTGSETYTVIDNLSSGPISGTFANLADGGIISAMFNSVSYDFVADYQGGDGNDLVLTVPEPTSGMLALASLCVTAGLRRFRRQTRG